MNDRELLELAARAAGIEYSCFHERGHWGVQLYRHGRDSIWNPLTDDGDKYRLERDLQMSINRDIGTVRCKGHTESFTVGNNTSEAYAIVRAAAEIGKGIE